MTNWNQLSPEQKEIALQKMRERNKKNRANMTPEQLAESRLKGRENMRKHRANMTEEQKQKQLEYYRKQNKERWLNMTPKQIEEYRLRAVRTARRRKTDAIKYYTKGAMHCMNPNCEVPGGAKDLDCLTIDHINGGGRKQERELKINGKNIKFYFWLRQQGYPDGFQCLCWNCNNKKRIVNREDHYAIKGIRGSQHLPKGNS